MEVKLVSISLNPLYYQNETCPNTSVVSDKHFLHVLTQCWRLETSSRAFYDLIDMTI